MAEVAPVPPLTDPAPRTPISQKVWFATLASIVVPALLAVGTYVLANEDVLGINNPVLGTFAVALITGLVTFLTGYLKRDPIREMGARRVHVDGNMIVPNDPPLGGV